MFTVTKWCFKQSEEMTKKGCFSNPKSGVSAISPLAQPANNAATYQKSFAVQATSPR
jgi:hypothetical protein